MKPLFQKYIIFINPPKLGYQDRRTAPILVSYRVYTSYLALLKI